MASIGGSSGGMPHILAGQAGELSAAPEVGIPFTGRTPVAVHAGQGAHEAGGHAAPRTVPVLHVPRTKPGEYKIPDWIKPDAHIWHLSRHTGNRKEVIVEYVDTVRSEVEIASAEGGVWVLIPFKVIAGPENPLFPMEAVPVASTSPAQSLLLGVDDASMRAVDRSRSPKRN